MSEVNTTRFRTLLKGKYDELLSSARDRDAIAVESTPDEMEWLDRQLSGHIAIFALDQKAIVLKSVKAALNRLDADIYGVCLQCEEPIAEKRLNAIPWAPYCVNCQEEVDAQPGLSEYDEDLM